MTDADTRRLQPDGGSVSALQVLRKQDSVRPYEAMSNDLKFVRIMPARERVAALALILHEVVR